MNRVQVHDTLRADHRFQDGALPHVCGVRSFQILRANRAHPEYADGLGWTYNHAPMLVYAYDWYFCEYLSNPVDEHEVPGHTLLTRSRDGIEWESPQIAFPEVEADTTPYRGPKSPLLEKTMLTVPHQRMGFYLDHAGVLLVLSFYGIVHDRHMSMPCDGWGIGRAVRRVFPDGHLGDIYFLIFNEPAGFTRENTHLFPHYSQSGDPEFIQACEELLHNGAAMRQMYEEQRFDRSLFPNAGAEALSYYTARDGRMVGMYKKSLVSYSDDQGQTWTDPEKHMSIHTWSGKVWGQKTSDGRYALLYNPTFDGQHRWPIAAVTGEDGYAFHHLAAITQDMSPQRYGGLDKNLGPQYMRGIAECNVTRPDDPEIHLVYSNNKEDIWISHIPVPLNTQGAAEGSMTWEHGFPDGLGVYSPVWAPVRIRNDELVLQDRDPYDRATVEVALGDMLTGQVRTDFRVMSVAEPGCITMELQDPAGRVVFRLFLKSNHTVYLLHDGRTEPFAQWAPGEDLHLLIEPDTACGRMRVRFGDLEKTLMYNASVNSLARFFMATKARIPGLSTLDSCGKYGRRENILPACDLPAGLTEVRVQSICWKHTEPVSDT